MLQKFLIHCYRERSIFYWNFNSIGALTFEIFNLIWCFSERNHDLVVILIETGIARKLNTGQLNKATSSTFSHFIGENVLLMQEKFKLHFVQVARNVIDENEIITIAQTYIQ